MDLFGNLKDKKIILASGSPRRQQFLKDLGLDYEIRLKSVEEKFPEELQGKEIAEYLAELKTEPYSPQDQEIIITGDTVVWHENKILHKPKNKKEAQEMLRNLSGKAHEVISATCLKSTSKTTVISATTKVFFKELADEEIDFYITNFKPFDKAGAYGIQEWIGKIGISKIEGSFYNVMGMSVDKFYEALKTF